MNALVPLSQAQSLAATKADSDRKLLASWLDSLGSPHTRRAYNAIDQASEIVFQGDTGDTSASRPSQRYGIEWTNKYRPYSWLTLDGDLAVSHARFLGYDVAQADVFASLAGFPQAQIGNAPGDYIPNAPAIVASAGITLGEKTGKFGGLRWRYLGTTPPRTTRFAHNRKSVSAALIFSPRSVRLPHNAPSSTRCLT